MTDNSDMVERVARAIYAARTAGMKNCYEFDELNSEGQHHVYESLIIEANAAINTMSTAPALDTKNLQDRVKPWMDACFGPVISADRLERNDRFIEEALELVQSCDYPRERVLSLLDYVYERPKGETAQEVGGVMITLAALCLANNIDMHEAGDVELNRIWGIVNQIREKQARKPTGSALPIPVPPAPAVDANEGALWSAIRSGVTMNFSIMRKIVEAERYELASAYEDELARKLTDRVLAMLEGRES